MKNFKYTYTSKPIINYSYYDYPITENVDSSFTEFTYDSSEFKINSDKDLLTQILYKDESDTLIPPGLKYLYKNFLVYERPPTHKLIHCYSQNLEEINSDSKLYSFYIPIPWQLYIAEFDDNLRTYSVRMYFMNAPLSSDSQHLYLPYIPNFYTNGKLCRPFFSSYDDISRYSQTIAGVIESSYDWVWSSNFNLDLTETISSIYLQKNPIEISRGKRDINYINFRIPFSVVSETYKVIESFSLSEISSFTFPNPSLNHSFVLDNENMDQMDLFHSYCEQLGIYCEDEESFDYFYEEVVSSVDFNEWIPKSEKTPKSFSQIKNMILFEHQSLMNNNSVFISSLLKLGISSSTN